MKFPLKLAGRLLVLPQEVEPLLSSACRYTHISQEREMGQSFTVQDVRTMYAIVGDEFVCPRGLLFRIESVLKTYGHELEVVEDLEPPRSDDVFKPNFDAIAGTHWRWSQLDAFFLPALHNDGIIDCVTAFGKTFIVGRICMGYPAAKILVVVPGIDLSTEMHSEITSLIGTGKAGLFNSTSKHRTTTRRVIVSTPESVHHVPDNWPDLIIYDECHTAPAEERTNKLMSFNRAKMFGFTGTSDDRADNAEMRMEAIFGPIRIVVTYADAREHGMIAEVTYHPVCIRTGVITSNYKRDMDKKRYPIWRNRDRGLILANEMIKYMVDNPGEQALFAVDKTEHALYIQQIFKEKGYDIPVVCGSWDAKREKDLIKYGALTAESNVINIQAKIREFRTAFIHKRTLYAIATAKFSTGADFRHLCFLVYGSGESGSTAQKQWAGRIMRLGDQDASEAKGIVIDAWDMFCPTTLNRSRKRKSVAKKAGWNVMKPRDGVL